MLVVAAVRGKGGGQHAKGIETSGGEGGVGGRLIAAFGILRLHGAAAKRGEFQRCEQ